MSFSLEVLRLQVAEWRRRRIHPAPLAFPASGPVGLLVCTASTDCVFYETDITTTHQTHVIVHEFGPLLCGHPTTAPQVDDSTCSLIPNDLDPTLVEHSLGRTRYSRPEECAAEYFATQLRRLAGELTPSRHRALRTTAAATARVGQGAASAAVPDGDRIRGEQRARRPYVCDDREDRLRRKLLECGLLRQAEAELLLEASVLRLAIKRKEAGLRPSDDTAGSGSRQSGTEFADELTWLKRVAKPYARLPSDPVLAIAPCPCTAAVTSPR